MENRCNTYVFKIDNDYPDIYTTYVQLIWDKQKYARYSSVKITLAR